MTVTSPLYPAERPSWRPAQAALSLMAVGAALGLPLLRVAPNRLVSGEAVSLGALLQGPVWSLAALLVALLLLSLAPPRRVTLWLTLATAAVLAVGLGQLAASHATHVVQADAPFARTSVGSGLWLIWLLMGLLLADALQALQAGTLSRLGVATAVLLPLALLLASGAADEP